MTIPSYTGPTEVVRCTGCRTVLETPTADGFDRPGHCSGCNKITEKEPVCDAVAEGYRNGWAV